MTQAETQFQGSGSSHELAALVLTEAVQHAVFSAKKPLFVIMLDAKSAFDKILVEFIIKNAFLAGSRGQGLLYLADRLSHRKTFVEWDKCLMGPIVDKLGVEQGGCLSDRLYKLANNEQLSVAQESQLGLAIDVLLCLPMTKQTIPASSATAFLSSSISSSSLLNTAISTMLNLSLRRQSFFVLLQMVLSQVLITGSLSPLSA